MLDLLEVRIEGIPFYCKSQVVEQLNALQTQIDKERAALDLVADWLDKGMPENELVMITRAVVNARETRRTDDSS